MLGTPLTQAEISQRSVARVGPGTGGVLGQGAVMRSRSRALGAPVERGPPPDRHHPLRLRSDSLGIDARPDGRRRSRVLTGRAPALPPTARGRPTYRSRCGSLPGGRSTTCLLAVRHDSLQRAPSCERQTMNKQSKPRPLRRIRRPMVILSGVALLLAIGSTANANLPGSTFEGNDGTLSSTRPATKDWVSNTINRVRGDDLASGSSDKRVRPGHQGRRPGRIGGDRVDPAAEERSDPLLRGERVRERQQLPVPGLGADERPRLGQHDFEINKLPQPNLTTTGPKTLNRSAGDLLITFDFTNGGGNPVLGLLKWVTTGATSQCFSANALPCWATGST